MNKEFGNRQLVGPTAQTDYEHDETMSTVSDAPSLHSWHHKMIVKNETVVSQARIAFFLKFARMFMEEQTA